MALAHNIEIIRQGKEAWNEHRKKNLNVILDLSFADLSGTVLDGYRLVNVDLTGANLAGCSFRSADLYRVDCSGANLKDAAFYSCRLTSGDFSKADFSKAFFGECSFESAGLKQANFSGASLQKINFSNANLDNCDLSGCSLNEVNFSNANCHGANLVKAKFSNSNFFQADFSFADLFDCYLPLANLSYAKFSNANLSEAFLSGANFYRTNLENADLSKALLQKTVFVETKIGNVILTNSFIYGLSAWDVEGKPKDQTGLCVTPKNRNGVVTVDDLQMGQFVHLLLSNQRIRNVIDTITSKTVLILGRFTPERKVVLDTIRDELTKYNYVPILFDFENSNNQTLLETVMTLAGMARFIIADITFATMVREELRSIVEKYPSKPIQPILFDADNKYVTFPEIEGSFKNVLSTFVYKNNQEIITGLKDGVIQSAENWLEGKKNKSIEESKVVIENIELKKQIEALQKKLVDAKVE